MFHALLNLAEPYMYNLTCIQWVFSFIYIFSLIFLTVNFNAASAVVRLLLCSSTYIKPIYAFFSIASLFSSNKELLFFFSLCVLEISSLIYNFSIAILIKNLTNFRFGCCWNTEYKNTENQAIKIVCKRENANKAAAAYIHIWWRIFRLRLMAGKLYTTMSLMDNKADIDIVSE